MDDSEKITTARCAFVNLCSIACSLHNHYLLLSIMQLLPTYVDSVDMTISAKRHLISSPQRLIRLPSHGEQHWSRLSPITFKITTINLGQCRCMAPQQQKATLH